MLASKNNSARVIIGANFGDEGKGRMVDHYSNSHTLVVRHNSGSQAGHTVTRSENIRHVFHHVGSGTLKRAETYLSEFFVHNPIAFGDEIDELAKIGFTPVIYADPNSRVTSHYEVMINQIVESSRDTARHGSCGLGFHETVVRDRDFCPLRIGFDINQIHNAVKRIRTEWVPNRLASLGIDIDELSSRPGQQDWNSHLNNGDILEHWLEDFIFMKEHFEIVPAEKMSGRKIIFESAQGLLLDEDNSAFFPHLTHSKTGIFNAARLAPKFGIDTLHPVYVTRSYMTRHGAGPFPTEVPGMKFEDRTNLPNNWQQTLRFGHLDLDLMRKSLFSDMASAGDLLGNSTIAVTCLDQTEDGLKVKKFGEIVESDNHSLLYELSDAFDSEVIGMPAEIEEKPIDQVVVNYG